MLLPLFGVAFAGLAAAACYESSFAHPPPEYDLEDPVLKDALKHIHDVLTIALGDPKYNSTSISVEVTSSKESLFEFHHTALERNASRPDIPQVNGSALYRIASITKVFTTLGLLQQHVAGNLSLDDPVEKYLTELQGPQNGTLPWKDITLRSLASQLSGIPREMAQSDMINAGNMDQIMDEWGLPPLSRESLPECDEYSENYKQPCGAKDLYRFVKDFHPIFAPNQQSTYSNLAFELLGLVIAKVTNQTYESYIDEAIFKLLGMDRSTFSNPPDSEGVIPLWPHFWDVDEGVQNPTGGIFSSTNDLSKFLRHVLNKYNGITNVLNWMNPASPAQDLHSFYGIPWEIFHTDRALGTSQRAVRFITKSGGLPSYTSQILVIPQYDLGVTLLLGGPPDFFETLREIVTIGLVRAAEQIAITSMEHAYAGRYISANPKVNSSLILAADHRGIVVEEFISNSTDMLQSSLLDSLGRPKDKPWHLSLVPTLLYRDVENQEGEIWRMNIAHERPEGETKVWDDFCITDIEGPTYAGIPVNQAVIWKGRSGLAYDIDLEGFRAELIRIFAHGHATSEVEEEEQTEL